MTDTIDIAALPSPAEIKRMVAWLRTMNLGNGSATTDAIATALQSQADALAEARRERDLKDKMWLYECEKHSQWLENYMREHKRALAAEAERTVAEASLATMREALVPFAEAAASYDPEEGDDAQAAWAHDFTIGSLRRARRALGGSNAE